jgi:hypothetical protein
MANDGKSKDDASSQDGRTGARSGAGARGKKPRSKPDEEVDKARPRVMRAADDDEEDEDDEEETEKARRSTDSDEEDDEEETEKARRSESDEEEEDDVDADKAADEDDEDDDEGEKDEKNKPKRGGPASSGKRATRAGKGVPGDKRPARTGKRTRKAGDDLVLPAGAKNTVLRVLSQALERLMAVANQVKDADEPDDESDVNVPDDLAEELEDIGELLEDVGEQLEEPAEKSRDKKPDAAKGRSAKADVSKAGRRMAKDRLERFQKALELLAAVLKELTNEKQAPTPSAGSAEKPLGKRALPEVGDLVTSVQELTRVVKQQGEQLGRLQKTRATSNAIPIEGGGRRREVQDVSWPLDMNRPITRDRVDKAISFYDEE